MTARRRGPGWAGAVTACLLALPAASAGAATPAPRAASDWTVYHGDPEGAGVAGKINLAGAQQLWASPDLDGDLFGEPLVDGATVVVATENDTVYALNAATGALRWSTHLGTPVPSSDLPCGDITPTVGITSTPVIDTKRAEVFVVGFVEGAQGPVHQLVGLSLRRGSVLVREDVDPPGIDTTATLQRVALTLDDGNVVFGDGGNFGDCSTYHGWVVSVPEKGGPMHTHEFDAAPGEDQGAVWMGGAAPEIDSHGDIWIAVGNGSVTSPSAPYDGSDSVVELSPTLSVLQYFAPSTWATDNALDHDLGSSPPALLSDGLAVQAGKSGTAYLLSQSKLGGIGGQLSELPQACAGDVDGGDAVEGTTVYLPCLGGVEALSVSASPPGLKLLWQAAGTEGPPIVAGGSLWTINRQGTLVALDKTTGAVQQQFALGTEANHFPTPSVGDGRLYAPGATRVFAFARLRMQPLKKRAAGKG